MQISNTKLGILAGLAVTGAIVYYFIKKNKGNAVLQGMARFAKCKNGTTVKIINDTPCANKGGIERIFVASDTQSALPSKPNQLSDEVVILSEKPFNVVSETRPTLSNTTALPTKPTVSSSTFVPIKNVDTFVNK